MRQKLGPLPPERYAELQDIIAQLKAEFGESLVKAEVNRRKKPNKIGRPNTRNYIRLFTLWVAVEASVRYRSTKIDEVCQFLESIGGIFEYTGYDARSYVASNYENFFRAFATNNSTIRRLYYEASKGFDTYETTFRDQFRLRLKLPPLKQRLLIHARQLADDEDNFIMPQFLSLMSYGYVNSHLYLDGTLSLPDFPGVEPMTRTEVSKRENDGDLSTRITSLFRFICGEDGRGAAVFEGSPRADGSSDARKARSS